MEQKTLVEWKRNFFKIWGCQKTIPLKILRNRKWVEELPRILVEIHILLLMLWPEPSRTLVKKLLLLLRSEASRILSVTHSRAWMITYVSLIFKVKLFVLLFIMNMVKSDFLLIIRLLAFLYINNNFFNLTLFYFLIF